ncbi:hypothetical protein AUK10_03365 [Candidatus Gracilibacteria bacterium CG2_30_37_12]|nr:MAG: hypothetical protein AUK10_03365 [Candidatus Gracilibacteria bacterium CG2_30_37_12]
MFDISRGNIANQKELISDPLGICFIAQNDNNNGFVGRFKLESHKQFKGNSLVVGRQTGVVYYQEQDFITTDGVLVLMAKNDFIKNKDIGLVITSALTKKMFSFSYTNTVSAEKLNKVKISLPVKSINKGLQPLVGDDSSRPLVREIDFTFMEQFIAELEAERIVELEAYLLATGLKNYTLTTEEEKVLEEFENGKFEWGEFRIEDVLQWQSQKEIDPLKLEELKDEREMMYPFYGQATINNGVISYNQLTRKVLNNEKARPTILIHSNNQNIVYLETPFYLKDGHGATSVLQSEKLNRTNQMLIVSSIDKVIKFKYSYNYKATKIELKNSIIKLITQNNQPDYKLMETLVSAIQKLVIKDVVLYADRKIEATKSVVEAE